MRVSGVTPDDERELFRQIARIDRRLGVLVAIIIAMIAFVASEYGSAEFAQHWGWDREGWGVWIIRTGILFGTILYLFREFTRSGNA